MIIKNSSKHMQSTNKKILIITGILIALVVGVLVWSRENKINEPGKLNYTYASELYGFSFIYPSHYTFKESYVEDPQAPRNIVALSDRSGSEDIKIEIFSNSLSRTPLKAWLRQSPASKLGTGLPASVTVGGAEAYSYSWEGGRATVLEHKGNIISISTNPDSVEAYEALLSTLKLN